MTLTTSQQYNRIRRYIVLVVLALAAQGCTSNAISPTAYIAPGATPYATAGPTAGATLYATTEPTTSPTQAPTPTEEPINPLVILDTYPSLEIVRQRLNAMTITHGRNGSAVTGRQMLEWILVSERYDPRATNVTNEELFAVLDGFDFPYPGARILLINVATGLFVEAHGLVPWSLRDYTPEQINSLFIEANSVTLRPDYTRDHGAIPADLPNTQPHWYFVPDKIVEDAHYKQFNIAHRLAAGASTQRKAIDQILTWFAQNFVHAIKPGYGWEVYLDGREPLDTGGPVAYPLTIERIYQERVVGCHEPTILLEGMLHSLNIPVVPLSMDGHGVLYLPWMDLYIHGDYVFGSITPPENRYFSSDEIRPCAEDEGQFYEVIKLKPKPPLPMLLKREGDYLHIYAERVYPFPDTSKCVEVSDAQWNQMAEQLAVYNVRYDTENCVISSDMVPIRPLPELSAPEQ